MVLKILTFIIDRLPDYTVENIPVIEATSTLLNIFAWANYLLPTAMILALVGATTAYYGFKVIYNGFKAAKDFIF